MTGFCGSDNDEDFEVTAEHRTRATQFLARWVIATEDRDIVLEKLAREFAMSDALVIENVLSHPPWSRMTIRETRLALAAAPKVAGPWLPYGRPEWKAFRRADHRSDLVCAIMNAAGTFNAYEIMHDGRGDMAIECGLSSVEAAKHLADGFLKSRGYLLDDEPEAP